MSSLISNSGITYICKCNFKKIDFYYMIMHVLENRILFINNYVASIEIPNTHYIHIKNKYCICCHEYCQNYLAWKSLFTWNVIMTLLGLRYALSLMLLVAKLTNTKWCKKSPEKWLKPWHMGTHLRERAFQWIPTWQGLDDFQKSLHPCALDN